MNSPDCTFQARYLPALVPFLAPAKDKRAWAKGIMVDPMPGGRGAYLIATNGRCMVVVQDLMARAPEQMIIGFHSAFVAEVKRLVKDDAQVTIVGVEGDQTWAADANAVIHCRNISTRYEGGSPDWRKLVSSATEAPVEVAAQHKGFEFDGIKRFSGFVDFTSPHASPHHISVEKRGSSFIVRSPSMTEAFGLIAGTIHPAIECGLPAWAEMAVGSRLPPSVMLRPPVESDSSALKSLQAP